MQRTLYLTPCAVALALAASAAGQVVYSTGFDSTDNPPFSRGSIGGQNGWFVAPSSASGTIQDVITASGGQALEVVDAASFGRAQKEISTSAIGPIFTSRYSMYVPTAWATIPAEVLDRFEAQQRVEFTDVGGGAHGVEFGFITTSAQYGELQPGQSAVYIEVTSDDVVTGAAFQVIDTASFVDAWHTFDLRLDVARGIIEVSMDGGPTLALGGATDFTNVSVLQFQNQRWGTSPMQNASLYFDSVNIEAVDDEPVLSLHPAGAESSAIWAINTTQYAGEAVFGGSPHAALWSGFSATFIDLNPAGAAGSRVRALEPGRQVGTAITPAGDSYALYWEGSAASAVSLHPAGARNSAAQGAAPGQQVGGADGRAGIWSGDAASFVTIHPTGAGASVARATNGAQQVGETVSGAGARHAALWSGSSASYIDLNPAGASSSGARALAGDQQAGWAEFGAQRQAGVWQGSSETFRSLHPLGLERSEVAATTGAIQVGYTSIDDLDRAAMWVGHAATWTDLHSMLPAGYRSSQATSMALVGDQVHIGGFAVSDAGRTEATLWRIPFPAACYADCDSSSALDFFDFLCYQNAFAAGDPYADCDGSLELDFFDFLCFQDAFSAACN